MTFFEVDSGFLCVSTCATQILEVEQNKIIPQFN